MNKRAYFNLFSKFKKTKNNKIGEENKTFIIIIIIID